MSRRLLGHSMFFRMWIEPRPQLAATCETPSKRDHVYENRRAREEFNSYLQSSFTAPADERHRSRRGPAGGGWPTSDRRSTKFWCPFLAFRCENGALDSPPRQKPFHPSQNNSPPKVYSPGIPCGGEAFATGHLASALITLSCYRPASR